MYENDAKTDIEKQWAFSNDGKMKNMDIDKNICVLNKDRLVEDVDINVVEMWEKLSQAGISDKEEVVVAIIDTGVNFDNKQLSQNKWRNAKEIAANNIDDDSNGFVDDIWGWDFVEKRPVADCSDNTGHGTACAGIICAAPVDGVAGVLPAKNIKVMALKVFTDGDIKYEESINRIIAAVQYAERNGAQICNISFGIKKYNEDLYNCIRNSNMTFICSAGNNNGVAKVDIDKNPYYPASFDSDNIITVANLGFDGQLYQTSNYGLNSVDLAAPGTNIFVMQGKNSYGYETGVSMATPFVSGTVATLLLVDSHLDSMELKAAICDTVTKNPSLIKKCKTGGYLNSEGAVKYVLEKKM